MMTNEDMLNKVLRTTFPQMIFIRGINELNKTQTITMAEEWLKMPYADCKSCRWYHKDTSRFPYNCTNPEICVDYSKYSMTDREVTQDEGHKGFENGWIKASEKLPDDYMPLYVTIEKDGKRVVEDSYFNAGDKVFVKDLYSNYAEGEVLAWMPWGILEPWKGK